MEEKAIFKVQELAKVAKVSPAAVSRVLHGMARAREESCQRVLRAIKELGLGYKSKKTASRLIKAKNYFFGLAVPYLGRNFSSYYEMQVVKGIDVSYSPLELLTNIAVQDQLLYDKLLLFKLFGLY